MFLEVLEAFLEAAGLAVGVPVGGEFFWDFGSLGRWLVEGALEGDLVHLDAELEVWAEVVGVDLL